MKANMKKSMARILCMAIAVCLMVAAAVPVFATEANQAITDAKSAVVQIQIWYVDHEMADEVYLGFGTGFLINEDTVVTCQHVVSGFSSEWYAQRAIDTSAFLGRERTAEEIRENLELRVSVLRDVHVRATIRQASTEMDYAILTLDDKLFNRTILPLRSSASLKQTEAVYALGFPGDLDSISAQNYYDADDVTINSGAVNKVDRFTFSTMDGGLYENVDCVESSALLTGGDSGGPLVDANGEVVGINAVSSSTRNLSVASDQLIATLDALGIQYTKADGGNQTDATEASTEAPTEEPTEASTEAPTEEPTEASTEAPTEEPTEVTVPPAKQEESGGNSMMIILIVAAVAVVAVIVVVVVVLSKGKKKKEPVAAGGGYVPPAPPTRPSESGGFTASPATPATFTTPMEAGETTVLNQDAGETTVLSRYVNGGTLIRKRNGEKISVNNEKFVIGRDRKSVNYCISDNSSISRKHVMLEIRGDVTYLVDLNAANGTFVNGSKAIARQEIALKDGDKITLSDEEFEYRK